MGVDPRAKLLSSVSLVVVTIFTTQFSFVTFDITCDPYYHTAKSGLDQLGQITITVSSRPLHHNDSQR